MVSVDCGIASLAEAEVAREVGLELIITDHHEMKMGLDGRPLLPPAAVLVHPRLPAPTPYPFGDLSGAGETRCQFIEEHHGYPVGLRAEFAETDLQLP